MTPAEAKNLRELRRRYVRVEWRSSTHDWPYFRLLAVDPRSATIKLQGMDYPDGRYKHDGDVFWCDWRDVREILPVVVKPPMKANAGIHRPRSGPVE